VVASVATAIVAWNHIDPVIATTPQGELRAADDVAAKVSPKDALARPCRAATTRPRRSAEMQFAGAMVKRRVLTILWPAFLMAGVLEMLRLRGRRPGRPATGSAARH